MNDLREPGVQLGKLTGLAEQNSFLVAKECEDRNLYVVRESFRLFRALDSLALSVDRSADHYS